MGGGSALIKTDDLLTNGHCCSVPHRSHPREGHPPAFAQFHTLTHTRMHAPIHTRTSHRCMRARIHVHKPSLTCALTYTLTRKYVHTLTHMQVHAYAHSCVYKHKGIMQTAKNKYINTHTHAHMVIFVFSSIKEKHRNMHRTQLRSCALSPKWKFDEH